MLLQRKHLAQVARICRPTTATFPPKLPQSNDAVTCESPCRQSFSKLLAPISLSTPAALAKVTTDLRATPVIAYCIRVQVLVVCKDGLCVCSKHHTAVTPVMLVRLSFANGARYTCTAYLQPPRPRTTWGLNPVHADPEPAYASYNSGTSNLPTL